MTALVLYLKWNIYNIMTFWYAPVYILFNEKIKIILGHDSVKGDQGADVPTSGKQFHPVAGASQVAVGQRHLEELLPLLRRYQPGWPLFRLKFCSAS